MYNSAHFALTASAAVFTQSPLLAPFAFASHFFLDMIGENSRKYGDNLSRSNIYILDAVFLVGLIVIAALAGFRVGNWWFLIYGLCGSAMDFIDKTLALFKKKTWFHWGPMVYQLTAAQNVIIDIVLAAVFVLSVGIGVSI